MLRLLLVTVSITFGACEKKQANLPLTEAQKFQRGELIYKSSCIMCHNADPRLAGVSGPDLANSSIELLRAHVISGQYPEGYTPKRSTHTMPTFPHLAGEL